jgi:hypothetical protein
MRRIVSLVVVVLMLSVSAFAIVNGNEVAYVGGSATSVKEGDVGTFDTTSPTELVFVTPGGKVAIPYGKLIQVDYKKEVAVHLGVAPAIIVALIKPRERGHFFTFTYTDSAGVGQAAIFEVTKNAPPVLLAILKARTPRTCLKTDKAVSCQAMLNRPRPLPGGGGAGPRGWPPSATGTESGGPPPEAAPR